jgi:hypothetical protein
LQEQNPPKNNVPGLTNGRALKNKKACTYVHIYGYITKNYLEHKWFLNMSYLCRTVTYLIGPVAQYVAREEQTIKVRIPPQFKEKGKLYLAMLWSIYSFWGNMIFPA